MQSSNSIPTRFRRSSLIILALMCVSTLHLVNAEFLLTNKLSKVKDLLQDSLQKTVEQGKEDLK
jgi:hypothetical protein